MIFLLGGSQTGKSWYFRGVKRALNRPLNDPATYHDNAAASKHVICRIVR